MIQWIQQLTVSISYHYFVIVNFSCQLWLSLLSTKVDILFQYNSGNSHKNAKKGFKS